MQNRWDPKQAAACGDELELRAYSSRLLGQDPSLVLHGGGNTSVKLRRTNLVGEDEDILYVKGSGWDLADIQPAGFAPVRMAHLLKLARLHRVSDRQMVNELKTQLTDAGAPSPSVETILHAALPYRYVDHTHADAVLAISDSRDGEARIRACYGDSVVVIPYVMPGFELARLVAERFPAEAHAGTRGMVLLQHGIFSFGDSAEESYLRMIELVAQAEDYLRSEGAWDLPAPPPAEPPAAPLAQELAALRRAVSAQAGFPLLLCSRRDPVCLAFARHPELGRIGQQGPVTPDHVIRTKRLPLLGRDVDAYAAAYRDYFARQAPRSRSPVKMLDPAPRVILDPELGLCSLGRSAGAARIVEDIYRHSIGTMLRAEHLGGYRALPESELFDVEYWELEQAKLGSASPPPFAGEVALVTGAASGIGKACVDAFLARGAAVVGLDRDAAVVRLHERPDWLGLQCDLTDEAAIAAALEQAVQRFGGLDMLVLNAGIFEAGTRIEALSGAAWRRTMAINLDANLSLLRECHPLLKLAPQGGRVAVIGSKNLPAPGPGAAAYSASKAGLNQLVRVAALEWAGDHIRLNSLHPDAVFDTGLWTPEVLEARARHYGMSVQAYKTKNLLGVEIRSRDVAELAAELCGPLFAKTTAAEIPIDGGNERVI